MENAADSTPPRTVVVREGPIAALRPALDCLGMSIHESTDDASIDSTLGGLPGGFPGRLAIGLLGRLLV